MAQSYLEFISGVQDPEESYHVQFYHPEAHEDLSCPIEIAWQDGAGVVGDWTMPQEWHLTPAGTCCPGFNDGLVFAKIPASEIKRVLTGTEVEVMERCKEADAELLRYAR